MYKKKVCYQWLQSASRVKREMRILPYRDRCLSTQILRDWVIPCQNVDTVDCATTLLLEVFLTMKLCSRLLMVCDRNFCKKRQIWVSEPYFGEVRSDTRLCLMARWKAHGQLSIRVNWTVLLSITVPELWGEMCTARLFSQGVDLFALKFYLDRIAPSTILGIRKQRYWAIRRWRPHPSEFSRFDTIPECDAETGGRTGMP